MKYLFVASHADDLELCCGGYISRQIECGFEVTILCLSQIYNGICLRGEWLQSMAVLKPDHFELHNFKVRDFQLYRQQILQLLYDYSKSNYDYVITHSANDFHIDHKIVGEESIRAFKHCNLITYLAQWNQRTYHNNYFVELTESNLNKKIEAITCYKSQSEKNYTSPDYIRANAVNNGVIAGVKYAEAYEVINYLV
jgi:N-acetylglucosamine malate deacetylase 1